MACDSWRAERWRIVLRGLLLTMWTAASVIGDEAVPGSSPPPSSPSESWLRFAVEPVDTVAVKDKPALLNCSATGQSKSSTQPVVSWKKEGTVLNFIGDARRAVLANGSLHFSSVYHTRSERPDEGIYQCVASLAGVGTIVSRAAKLQVALLPRFDDQPSDLTTFPSQTAYFPCSVPGVPPVTVQWLKDEHPLVIDPLRMLLLPSGALEIDLVQATDAGIYTCNVSNIEKHRLSNPGLLTVNMNLVEQNKISAPTFIAVPKSTVVVEGTNLTLDCVANGNPRPKIMWLKDGATIDLAHLDSRFRIVGVGSLQMENVKEGDEGTYMCRAENHEDSVDTSATVEVEVVPRFIRKPENKFAYEKEDVEFECEIYGKREPTIQWLKNGEKVIENEYFQIVNGYNLKILGLVPDDQGIYQCMGSNPAGNIQSSAQLIILDPETPLPSTRYFSVTTPDLVTAANPAGAQIKSKDVPTEPRGLSAVIVSTRFATLSWQTPVRTNGDIFAYSIYYKEDTSSRERVINTTRPTLEEVSVRGLRPATRYYFRVVAYNQHGPGISSPEILIETNPEVHVPGPPRNLHIMAQSPTAILAEWDPPDQGLDQIQNYKLYYMEVGTAEQHEITTSEMSYVLKALKKYTEYTIWVVAYNKNGPGLNSDEITVRTLSDVPSDIPQNVTVEAASSTSIIVRWEPPPKESQNGIITGYKIRFKLKGSRRGDTVTTDGNRKLYALTGLERGAQYSIKIAALSVNGSGPSTEWMVLETYQNDLDESRVPDQPSKMRGRPTSNSIYVTWSPPVNQNVMIRGYTIGWGIGFPDVYFKVLDGKQRYYTIDKNLQPSSEYVISLRAFNQVGDGVPVYDTVKTLVETTPEPLTPMIPPVGLKAIVLSSSTVVLYWTDSSLPRNQVVTDNRYYTVRYTSYTYSANPKYRYFNSTDLNCMIDDLKPNTQYEFAVKVVKIPRESAYSMSTFNTTQEAAPSSPPRDLTIVLSEEDATTINLHWQPPKQPNGQITGYVIFYTTDNTQRDRDWVVEAVVGEKLTKVLKGLTPDTTYFFKIQARNNKGYGPLSLEVTFHTDSADNGIAAGAALRDGSGLTNNMLYIIIACVSGVTLIIIIAVSAIMCRRRNGYLGPVRNNKGYGQNKVKGAGKELKPPDLWIHHDHMELKAIDKGHNGEATMTVTPIPRNSQELSEDPLLGTLEKKKATYIGDYQNDDKCDEKGLLMRRPLRAKPIMIPLDIQQGPPKEPIATATPLQNGTLNPHLDSGSSTGSRPLYPRTQYNIPRAHVTIDTNHPVSTPELPSPGLHSEQGPLTYEQVTGGGQSSPPPYLSLAPGVLGPGSQPTYSSASTVGVGVPPPSGAATPSHSGIDPGGTLTKRMGVHPLKSFSVPAPPPHQTGSLTQPKHMAAVRPQLVTSPLKKSSSSSMSIPSMGGPSQPQHLGGAPTNVKSRPGLPTVTTKPSDQHKSKEEELTQSYSTEELNLEMANLEGLMKDLNAITASEFEC